MATLNGYPAWARQLSEQYYSRTLSMFVLHGNVQDLVPWERNGQTEFLPLDRFLKEALFGRRDIVISYDRGGGLSFGDAEMQKDFSRAMAAYDTVHGTRYAQGMPRNPDVVLSLLESYLRIRIQDGRKIALCLGFAETIAPASGVPALSSEDRNSLVILRRWAQNPAFLSADVTFCLITENLTALHPNLVRNAGVAAIPIPMPDAVERAAFLRTQPVSGDVPVEVLSQLTAGLKRIQLQNLVAQAKENRQPLTVDFLTRLKKNLIRAESGGLLEFVESRYTLDAVSGHDAAKRKLRAAADAIRNGQTAAVPMGYVICGPVGTGKSFLTTCFAGEAGIPAVTLKNFRSMWQGETEANLERVLNLLQAMSPIVVIVDEADAQLGDRSNSGDSGVSNRVFAQIAQFMGNTENRGKVIWFLLTCRPDLLPVDLKRQGRAEEHIALFYPETPEERRAMLRTMVKKTGAPAPTPEQEQLFLEKAHGLSGADMEALLARARLSNGDLQAAIDDFVSPSYPTEIEQQTLAAVLECTSRSLLPERYRNAERGELLRRMQQLSVGD